MGKGRMEAFSDGVLAVIITIMVLEMKVPQGTDLNALRPLAPVLACYFLSFVNVGIYWNNHHHLIHAANQINGQILWANLHLLFWLSLFPFVTGLMGENHFAPVTGALYGIVSFMAALAYTIPVRFLINVHRANSEIATAIGDDRKGKISLILYAAAILLAVVLNWISVALYIAVAAMWFVPARLIETDAI